MTAPRRHPRARLAGALLLCLGALTACSQEGELESPSTSPAAPISSAPELGTPGDGGTSAGPGAPAPTPPRNDPREWVVSPGGSDSAAGSSAAPFRSIAKAVSVVGPGERITVKAGTYAEPVSLSGSVRDGTAAAPIRLQGEGRPVIVPSGSSVLVAISKAWWEVDGFEVDVKGQAKFAVAFTGNTQGSRLSGSDVHHGSLGGGITTYANATGAIIENNDIHHFTRSGQDSHGVVVQPTSKNITIRNNRIHDNTGDAVQCIGPEGFSSLPPADGVVIQGNEMFTNFENAVDIKTCHNVKVQGNVMRDYGTYGGCAVVVHMSARDVLLEDNDIFNVGKAIAIGGNHEGPVPTRVLVRRNRIRNVRKASGLDGDAIRLENSESAQVVNNTMVDVGNAGIRVGGGTGGATSNLSVYNNIVQAAVALHVGTQAPGLKLGANLYAPSSTVNSAGSTLSLSAWLSQGKDPGSVEAAPQLPADGFTPGSNAIDRGREVGLPFCGAAPDIGAVETGC
ncbi:MAG TPA: right-handed parallel beta-helix repeat-containing protein [Aggregicoccus sp.]|nr:right-handed parallel beta-helix repeat-containing protein [Aggregicoccus sp.]